MKTSEESYTTSEYCLNTLHAYQFEGTDGMFKLQDIMKMFRFGFDKLGNIEVENILDYSKDIDGHPKSEAVKYMLAGGSSVVISPSATEPKLEVRISIISSNEDNASEIESRVRSDIENIIYIEDRMGYCCE